MPIDFFRNHRLSRKRRCWFPVTYRVTNCYPRSVVGSFGCTSLNSASLGLVARNRCPNPKKCQLVPIIYYRQLSKLLWKTCCFLWKTRILLWKTATKLSALALNLFIAFKKIEELRSPKSPSSSIPQLAVCWKYSLNISSFLLVPSHLFVLFSIVGNLVGIVSGRLNVN